MMAGFDDRGRLYVCDSAGVNVRGPELSKTLPHCIRLLEDVDGDGVFETSKVFADKLVFPQGVCWHDGWVYVSSPPNFWRMRDTDGDGVADKREILVTGFANTGVADDMHGGCVGPDGRIYWCAGRFPHELKRPNGPVIHKGTAPLILRCKPDGSEFEVVCGSQGNAVGVAFTPEGDMFSSGTYLAPAAMGAGLRDAVIHCVDGGEYPVRDRILTEHRRTGDLLPPMIHLGFAAASDLTSYRHEQFGGVYRGNLFVALFNMHKIVRMVLEKDGAGYKCRMEDFLVSSDPDFHPTDVLEDADGSLLVLDTGAWFRIGCPTSQVAKPQVKGAIYRVRKQGVTKPVDPRGLKIPWKSLKPRELVELLNSRSPEICDRAMAELARGNWEALEAVGNVASNPSSPANARLNALWTLTRSNDYFCRDEIRRSLTPAGGPAFQVAARGAGIWRDRSALPQLSAAFGSNVDVSSQREAATALGRIGDPLAVPALIARLRTPCDRFLEHALIFALIQIGDRMQTMNGLSDASALARRACLIAMDQMKGGGLTASEVARHLTSPDAVARQGARWVAARHPEWGKDLLPVFRKLRSQDTITQEQRDELQPLLLTFCANGDFQKMIADMLVNPSTTTADRSLLFATIAQAPLDRLPFVWKQALRSCLDQTEIATVSHAVSTLRAAPTDRPTVFKRVDAQIDFSQPNGPALGTPLKADYSVYWSGKLAIVKTAEYVFALESDDGSRLTVDGQTVIDNGGFHGKREKRGTVSLAPGEHDIEVEYFLRGTGGSCKLSWLVDGVLQAVPASVLTHPVGNTSKSGLLGEYFDFRSTDGRFVDFRQVDFATPLEKIANDAQYDARTRLDALAVLNAAGRSVSQGGFSFLLDCLRGSQAPTTRLSAADILSRSRLSETGLRSLLPAVEQAGVLELPKLLPAFESATGGELGQQLIVAISKSPGVASLKAAEVQAALRGFGPEVAKRAEPLLAKLTVDLAAQKAKLKQLEPLLDGGNAGRGREVFLSKKALCSTCHQIRGEGGKIGPDLTKIAAIRAPGDLLVALVFPSASFARGYEPYSVVCNDGTVRSGIIARESSDAIYIYDANRAEQRIARSTIEQIRRSDVSIMPLGLDTQLNKAELADLFAYLRSLKN